MSESSNFHNKDLAKENTSGAVKNIVGNVSNILASDITNSANSTNTSPASSPLTNSSPSSTNIPTASAESSSTFNPTASSTSAPSPNNIPAEKIMDFSAMSLTKGFKLGRGIINMILKRLYYLIVIPAIYITYNVLKALTKKDSTGKSILDNISDIISEVVNEIMYISDHCPQLIGDFPKFIDCLGF